MFILLCFSGNPIVTRGSYSDILLVGYTFIFFTYTLFTIKIEKIKKIIEILSLILILIFLIVFFQNITLGYVSYPGTIGYVIKIILGLSTILYYQHVKIDFIETYIKTLAFLALLSLPFFILNQFGYYGLELKSSITKSLLIHTSIMHLPNRFIARNCGMFWEPGAFAGYLILALVFIAIKNRKFQIGPYKKEVFWILIALLTTTSTTGFIVLGFILVVYSSQNYRYGKILIVPFVLAIMNYAYFSLDFMQQKIEKQYQNAIEMDENEISASRFGALKMDLVYIKSQPLIGNGLHVKTRFRFHPEIKGDIGHGNGMSNFIACWGIPFFLLWLYCVYKFIRKSSRSIVITFSAILIIILLLQGEQFLNYPLFLSFFFLPFVYKNILSTKNKIHLIKNYFNYNSV